ncbi:MAG: MraY family glycosyltransferase [Paludibacteraceae bacterium]
MSFVIGYLFMPIVIEIAKKHNFVVSPNKRTSHNGDIPNIGGINIFVSFLLTVFFFSFNLFSEMQFILLGLAIILIVGFIDDLMELKVSWKLLGQLLAGFFLIVGGNLRFTTLAGFWGVYEFPLIISYLLTFFVFVLVVNALNLIDGVDGLASGLGILYSLFFGIYFHLTGNQDLSISAFAMVGSLSVFFYYNVFSHRNKIFMGDSGSLLLGYMMFLYILSFCELNAKGEVPESLRTYSAVAVVLTVLLVPLFDTLRVVITRLKKGRSPFSADRNHIHHLLLGLGLKHREVSFLLMFITVVLIIIALLTRNLPVYLILLIDAVIAISLTLLLWNLINKKNKKEAEQKNEKL